MSIYWPDPDKMTVVRHDGTTEPFYMVHDQFGEYDGPYASEGAAWGVINNIRRWMPGGDLNLYSRNDL